MPIQLIQGMNAWLDACKKLKVPLVTLSIRNAKQCNLPLARLRNSLGEFVMPTPESIRNAAATFSWTPDFQAIQSESCADCWPITAPSYMLIPRHGAPRRQFEAFRFLNSMYQNSELMEAFDYVPLPHKTVDKIR